MSGHGRKKPDPELAALKKIVRALAPFDRTVRTRMMSFLNSWAMAESSQANKRKTDKVRRG